MIGVEKTPTFCIMKLSEVKISLSNTCETKYADTKNLRRKS